jgi:hypothetical protein
MSKSHAIEAGETFFRLLIKDGVGRVRHPAKTLVMAAFRLYENEWAGTADFDVRRWVWPETTFKLGASFEGDEPWTVLLRRAVEIVRGE